MRAKQVASHLAMTLACFHFSVNASKWDNHSQADKLLFTNNLDNFFPSESRTNYPTESHTHTMSSQDEEPSQEEDSVQEFYAEGRYSEDEPFEPEPKDLLALSISE
jgi:hypothetical protein